MKLGLLAYSGTNNLGDEIQSLAARRFLPRVDHLVDRDTIGDFESTEPLAIIMNGWYGHRLENWPPPDAVHPLLVSMHLSPVAGAGITRIAAEDYFLREPAVSYLRDHGPVGARDLRTLSLLEKHGVPAYFSGCLTLTLERDEGVAQGEDIVLNDVPEQVFAHLRARTDRRIVHATHTDRHTVRPEERFARAEALLRLYQSAHCVVTTRLHCALPCLALGTPVLLLDVGEDPTRFAGLAPLVRRCTVEDFVSGRFPFPLERPEPNAQEHLLLRRNLEKTVHEFVARALATDGAPARANAEPTPSIRLQTLVHVHADLVVRNEALATSAAGLEARLEQARHELEGSRRALDDTRRALDGTRHELEETRRAVRDLQAEIERREANLVATHASDEWRTAMRIRRVKKRLARLTKPARSLFGKPGA